MSDWFYERLSQQDNSFLVFEGPNNPMHVGAVQIFDAGAAAAAAGRHRPRAHRGVRRLAAAPDPALPAAARPHADRAPPDLDRRRALQHPLPRAPLAAAAAGRRAAAQAHWSAASSRSTSTAGSRSGRCGSSRGSRATALAIVSKIHHCMVDGISGVDLLAVLLTPEPIEKIDPPHVVAAAPGAERRAARARRGGARAARAARRRGRAARPRARPRSRARAARAPGSARSGASAAAPACSRRARRSTSPSARTGASTGCRWTCAGCAASRSGSASPSTTSCSPPRRAACGAS